MKDRVRMALQQTASLAVPAVLLKDQDDLYDAGLSSFDLINLITYLEDLYGIEFTIDMMNRETFVTIENIAQAIDVLQLGRTVQ